MILSVTTLLISCSHVQDVKTRRCVTGRHEYNESYSGDYLSRIAFPVGGLGAGMFCIEGTGYFSHMSVRHHPDIFNEPKMYAAFSIKGLANGAKVLEGPVPDWRKFGGPQGGKGSPRTFYGFPRFEKAAFKARFPFCEVALSDPDMPVTVTIEGWSPFIPGDADNSSLPVGIAEYTIENTGRNTIEGVFSFHSPNFMKIREEIKNHIATLNGFNKRYREIGDNSIRPLKDGFILSQSGTTDSPYLKGDFAIFTDQPGTIVDHCWFQGGKFDAPAMIWKALKAGETVSNNPVASSAPGASLYVPVTIKKGEKKTIRVYMAWYVPESGLKAGEEADTEAVKKAVPGKKESENEDTTDYRPWYSARFSDINDVVEYLLENYGDLRSKTDLFSESFYESTLPPAILEAVAANLTILKSPTILRTHDGRLWGWEGSDDDYGTCYGSCTHVWNYAQSIPHLFPSLERTLRETEFRISQNEDGEQAFRSNLPFSKPRYYSMATDGQLGGLMKVFRDWRISGDTDWLEDLYPLVQKSMDCCIKKWDPGNNGYLEEPHHSTYDVSFWGPDGMSNSYYLGALTAMIEMSKALNKSYESYSLLRDKGKKFVESQLFNGEYFNQIIKWTDLQAENPENEIDETWDKREIIRLREEGPRYQYGNGCLSDGVIGMWMASVCGLEEILDHEKVESHLTSVYRYNLKKDLSDHINPQRPGFAMGKEGGLLLCSWPLGDELTLPFIYSREVWTGVEYEVAAHLMFMGRISEALDIVQTCRDRYDGRTRNPFDEYECGHWYARAMSSYSMLQALTGIRYDAVSGTLFIDSAAGDDFNSFFSCQSGFGNIGLQNGKPFVEMASGSIDIKQCVISGNEMPLSSVKYVP